MTAFVQTALEGGGKEEYLQNLKMHNILHQGAVMAYGGPPTTFTGIYSAGSTFYEWDEAVGYWKPANVDGFRSYDYFYDPEYPYGPGADPSSYTRSDWPYWSPYSSYSGTDTTSIEDWLHFSIYVASEKAEYNRGETVTVTISVRNKAEQEALWLGVSFKDPTGESAKYDPEITITPESATIDYDKTKTFTAEWAVPDDAPAGVYKIAVNCWKDDTFTDWYSDDLEWASIFRVSGSTLSVRAENDVPGPVEISMHADGVLIGTLSFDDNDNSWSVESISIQTDTSTIKLTFVNDWYLGPEATLDSDDRNAYINWLVIDGVRIEAEDFDRTGRNGVIYYDGEWAYPYGIDEVYYEPLAGGTIISMFHSPDWVELSTSASKSASGTEAGKYWKEIFINENSGKTLTDYQIMVDLRGGNFSSYAKTDGADIRFYDAEGEELSYWIEEYDYAGKHAKIWVKVPGIPANEETRIMMYYGDEEAGSVSDGDRVFVFFDDFNDNFLDSSKWDKGPTCSVYERNKRLELITSGWYSVWIVSKDNYDFSGSAVTIKVVRSTSMRTTDVPLWVSFVKNLTGYCGPWLNDFYRIGINHEFSKTQIIRRYEGEKTELYEWPKPTTPVWYRILLLPDNRIQFYESRDGVTFVLKYSEKWFWGSNTVVYFTLEARDTTSSGTWYDDFIVRKYTSPEPTITIGA